MAARVMMVQKVLFVSIIVSVFVLIIPGGAFAKIPEPDNIIYGIAGDDVVTVTLEVNGQAIASYTMGDNPDAGDFYILRVPLDSLEPTEPGTARIGDEVYIFINDESEPAAAITIGERGSIQKVHLTSVDSDGDGLPDAEEQYLGTNPQNPDTDGDGLSDAAEINDYKTNPLSDDTDADGYWDGHEVGSGSNPAEALSYPATTTINLTKGFNLIVIPADVTIVPDLRDWLPLLGDVSFIEKVMVYDEQAGKHVTLIPGEQSAEGFVLRGGEGLIVYAKQDNEITFTSVLCSTHDLKQGINQVGFACPAEGYTAYQLLSDLGNGNVSSIQRYSLEKGAFETAGFGPDGELTGVDFPIVAGEGYFIFMKQEVLGFGP